MVDTGRHVPVATLREPDVLPDAPTTDANGLAMSALRRRTRAVRTRVPLRPADGYGNRVDGMISKPLTPKQEKFCLAYMTEPDASKAYRVAYSAARMKDKQIWEEASKLLANPKVAQRVKELRSSVAEKVVVDEGRLLTEALRLALSDPINLFDEGGNLLPIHKMSPATRAAISSIEMEDWKNVGTGEIKTRLKKVKLWDKNSSMEKLFKHLGSYERDNAQRAGIFDKLPKGEVDRIVEELRALNRPELAGDAISSSASRFTH